MRNASSAYSLKAFTATKTLLGSWSAPASAVIYYDPVAAKHEIVGEDITLTTTDGNVYTLRYQSGALGLLGTVINAGAVVAPAILGGKLYLSYPQAAKISIYTWLTDHWQKEADKTMPSPMLYPLAKGASDTMYGVTATQLLGINKDTGAVVSGFPVPLAGMPIDSPVVGEMDDTQPGEEVVVSLATGKRVIFNANGVVINKELQARSFVDSQVEVYDTANKGMLGAARDIGLRIIQIGKQLIASMWGQIKTIASIISGGGGGTGADNKMILNLSFDEGAGTTAFDQSKNKITTITQATWQKIGKQGSALDFEEDTKGYVTVPKDREFHAGGNGFTWSAWIKPESLTHNHQIMYDADTNGCEDIGLAVTKFGEVLFSVDGTGCGQQGIGLIKTTIGSISNGAWSHITAVADYPNKTASVYVNGRFIASDSIDGITPIDRAMLVSIGRLWDGGVDGQYFDGLIDEVEMYNYALTPEEVQRTSGDVVGLWSSEDTGDAVQDSSGHSRNGTATQVIRSSGWKGKGFEFRKSQSSYITIPGQSAFHGGPQGYTWSAWIKLASSGYHQIITDADTNGCEDLNFYVTDKGELVFGVDGQGCSQQGIGIATTPAGTIETGKWYHVAGVADFAKETVSVYVNGVQKASDTMPGITPITRAMKFSIGRWTDGAKDGRYFDGVMDEIVVHNYPLNQEVIVDLGTGALVSWLFDDEPIKTLEATDSTGHGFIGAIAGALVVDGGRYGRALDFEKDNQNFVSLPANALVHNPSRGYTWSAWIKPESLVHNHVILSDADTAGCEDLQFFITQPGEVVFGVDGAGCGQQGIGTVKTTPKSVEVGKWTHVSGVTNYEKQEAQVYVDGVLAGTKTMAGINPIMRGMNINIGRAHDGIKSGAYFDGLIDEVKIYPYPQSDKEVRNDMAIVVGYWDMDTISGTTLPDLSRSGHNGTVTGATLSAGKKGNGLDFEAESSQYVTIQNGDVQFQGSPLGFTWAGWVKPESARYQTIISDADGRGCEDIVLSLSDKAELLFTLDGTGCGQQGYAKLNSALGAVPANEWRHVAVVVNYQKSTIGMYINGVLVALKSTQGITPIARPMIVSVGRWWDGGAGWGYFDGMMDEVKMLNYPVSQAEVIQMTYVSSSP